MNHQYMAYGGWSFSNKDYYFENLTSYMNEPIIQDMMDIVDPYGRHIHTGMLNYCGSHVHRSAPYLKCYMLKISDCADISYDHSH